MEIKAKQQTQTGPVFRFLTFFVNGWRQYTQGWIKKHIPPAHRVELNLHNIFIVPYKQGLAFSIVLILMFIGAVNYELSLAFSLVFWLLALFVLTIFYTYRNLAGLHVSAVSDKSVFAGENAEITIVLNRYGKRVYESIFLGFREGPQVCVDLINAKEQRSSLYVPTQKRGYFSPGRLVIETFFPFGLCRAWSLLDLNINCLVYPQPIACDLDWLSANENNSGNTNVARGSDDFHDLREYQKGDSLKHVAWKIYARGQGMYTKQYSSNVDDKIWLNWDMFGTMAIEEKLSRLCYCVLKLDANSMDYGLNLPGVKISPAKGPQHYRKVLETLALYGLPKQTDTAYE